MKDPNGEPNRVAVVGIRRIPQQSWRGNYIFCNPNCNGADDVMN